MRVLPRRRLLASASAAVVAVSLLGTGPVVTATATPVSTAATATTKKPATKPAKTNAKEAHRVDRVKTPKLKWTSCPGYGNSRLRCAWLTVPLDYDQPKGGTTRVRLLRNPATGKHRIGSLFVNPGGPGGSATELAAEASSQFSAALRQRYDIIGMDPRGTNASSQVHCFASSSAQEKVLAKFTAGFPVTPAEEASTIAGAKALGKACSSHGRRLASSMSTAEVARDMDVARRAVGSTKLNYFGFSYGTYLGEVYANLFPDRYRVLAIDGVVDPIAWAGTAKTRNTPLTVRLGAGPASWKALSELLRRCDRAGHAKCELAGGSLTSAQKFALLAGRLKQHPIPLSGGSGDTLTYAVWISFVGSELYQTSEIESIPADTATLLAATEPDASARTARSGSDRRLDRFAARLRAEQTARGSGVSTGFGYDNDQDAYSGVQCTDGLEPASANAWSAAAAATDARAPYFGRSWAWASAPCATQTWTAHDEDAYRGPFDRRVAKTILVVGNTWDPATSYQAGAKQVDKLPNTRLLTSHSWGHTAYGTSTCVTSAVDRYLLTGKLPAAGKTCTGAFQPYGAAGTASGLSRTLQRTVASSAPIS